MTQKLGVSVSRKDSLTFKYTFALLYTSSHVFLNHSFVSFILRNRLKSRGIKAFGGLNADTHELVISGDMNQ